MNPRPTDTKVIRVVSLSDNFDRELSFKKCSITSRRESNKNKQCLTRLLTKKQKNKKLEQQKKTSFTPPIQKDLAGGFSHGQGI